MAQELQLKMTIFVTDADSMVSFSNSAAPKKVIFQGESLYVSAIDCVLIYMCVCVCSDI